MLNKNRQSAAKSEKKSSTTRFSKNRTLQVIGSGSGVPLTIKEIL